METAAVDNDTRGWIMCAVSGIACVVGASVIFVDLVVRQFPGKHDFRIQDSNLFLAGSLSMGFGVMLFSALYSMLPSSKPYLVKAGYSESDASLIVMTAFVGGFVGIQAISRVLHQFMPSHVVDCDHSHDQVEEANDHPHGHRHDHGNGHEHSHSGGHGHSNHHDDSHVDDSHNHNHNHDPHLSHFHDIPNENTPLVAHKHTHKDASPKPPTRTWTGTSMPAADSRSSSSVFHVPQRVLSFVKDTKSDCDEVGPCYGYTDPCAQECFKHVGGGRVVLHTTAVAAGDDVEAQMRFSRARSRDKNSSDRSIRHHHHTTTTNNIDDGSSSSTAAPSTPLLLPPPRTDSRRSHYSDADHHHHVPTNPFMAIGLQTSIAITLHKFPEGFITYATNHANPALGFSVFMALFVHNISEGFALALPLYMALGSRARAMAWASCLGGLSQPLGAAIAALWFRLSAGRGVAPGAVFYAVLFAVTAGIMVSVALQLFAESMSLCHSRNMCIFFGFLGMAVLGFSGALMGHDH